MQVPQAVAEGSIRLSLGSDTTMEEVETATELIGQTVAELRLFQRN
jgi:cysteine sulfinate desulfinase/cysteine desulfurase-like protein